MASVQCESVCINDVRCELVDGHEEQFHLGGRFRWIREEGALRFVDAREGSPDLAPYGSVESETVHG